MADSVRKQKSICTYLNIITLNPFYRYLGQTTFGQLDNKMGTDVLIFVTILHFIYTMSTKDLLSTSCDIMDTKN